MAASSRQNLYGNLMQIKKDIPVKNQSIKLFIAFAWLALAFLIIQPSSGFAQGTAFTYQGRLMDGTNPAAGMYDLRFAIYDAASGGTLQGSVLTNSLTPVTNGLFVVTLDFGNQFPGAARWLEIGVRTNGAADFVTLAARQKLTPAPYAITAGNVVSGGLTGVYGNAITLSNPGNQISGAFTGNGFGVTNVNAASLGGLNASNFWQISGNNVAVGQFLGSTNNQALDFKVGGSRALRLEPDGYGFDAPNVIGGSSLNYVAPGTVGAVIAGGGAADYAFFPESNSVAADFGAIGGGFINAIQANSVNAVIAGGQANTIQTNASVTVIGGGNNNVISYSSDGAVVVGGQGNSIGYHSTNAFVGGGFQNAISYFSIGDFIGGGANNSTYGDYSSVVGGSNNAAITYFAFIGGGEDNTNRGQFGVIGGGQNNSVLYPYTYDVIGGGQNNTAGGHGAVIGGGFSNQTGEQGAFVGAGDNNTASGFDSGLVGGSANQATGTASFVGGGDVNIASGGYSVIGGGSQNGAAGTDATVPGGYQNFASGNYSFAAGHEARAQHDGTFVWADSQNAQFVSTASNQFLIRASGNVGINTTAPNSTLEVNGQVAASSLRAPGAGVGTATFAFIQRSVATNTLGNVTTIYNPLTDGDPGAIVMATHNWTADTNSVTKYDTTPFGVYYNGVSAHWAIFNEDGTSMALGRAFNVMVIKP